jgi:hypothetical protein
VQARTYRFIESATGVCGGVSLVAVVEDATFSISLWDVALGA